MGTQAIDLSAGLVPAQPSVDLSSGLVPKSEPTKQGFFSSLADSSGLSSLAHAVAHPIETLTPAVDLASDVIHGRPASDNNPIVQGVQGAVANAKAKYEQGMEDFKKTGAYLQTRRDFANAIPVIGPILEKGEQQTDSGNNAGAMGTLAGLGVAAVAPKVIETAAPAIADTISATPDAIDAAKQYVRPKPTAAIVAPEEMQAQKIAQSILPPGGIKPEFLQSIQAEAPAVKAYADRTGNPLNTQAEGLKAAQGVAQEGLQHYQSEVLAPVANRSVVLDPANTDLGDKATIGDIDSRITKLNKLINTAPANSAGAALDVLAKSKWSDEVGYLRSKLYPALETTTGIPAADIQQLREGYGGEFSLANNLEAAQNARLTRTGQLSQGQQTVAGKVPTSLADIPMKVVNAARGGEQAISDRQFSSAMQGVKGVEPIRPTPPPIDTDAAAAQQAAAQQEFLRQHQLEQASQDSAANRSQVSAAYKGDAAAAQKAALPSAGKGPASWAASGTTKVLQHIREAGNTGLSAADIQNAASTPAVQRLLINASDLTPGSPAMSNLVQQIKTTLGASK